MTYSLGKPLPWTAGLYRGGGDGPPEPSTCPTCGEDYDPNNPRSRCACSGKEEPWN